VTTTNIKFGPDLLCQEPGLRVIRLTGNPAQMGYDHGKMLASEIRELRRAMLGYFAKITWGLGGLPLYLALAVGGARFWPFIPQSCREEMQGVAAGAAVGLHSILLLNVIDDLANNLPRCSAFAVGGRYGRKDTMILGRNLDYPVFTQVMTRQNTVFLLFPETGNSLVSVAWPGYIGICTGLSASRVALAQLTTMTRDRSLRGLPAGLRNRRALQLGGDLDEVSKIMSRSPRTMGNNLLLAGPGRAQVLEVSARHWAQRNDQDGLITATNHYQHPEMQQFKGRFPIRPPFSPLSPHHFTEAYSISRNQRLQDLAQPGNIGRAQAQEMLADSGVANLGTVTSVIIEPQELRMWVARSLHPPVSRGEYCLLSEPFSATPRIDGLECSGLK
jgi:hypothetical protein